jgi:hypothetical protein
MLAQCISELLDFCQRSFSTIHFEQRLENLESLYGSLPSAFRYRDEIGRPLGSVPGRPIWCGVPDCDVFKSTFAQFSDNNRVLPA